jgi:hypothetical protein
MFQKSDNCKFWFSLLKKKFHDQKNRFRYITVVLRRLKELVLIYDPCTVLKWPPFCPPPFCPSPFLWHAKSLVVGPFPESLNKLWTRTNRPPPSVSRLHAQQALQIPPACDSRCQRSCVGPVTKKKQQQQQQKGN